MDPALIPSNIYNPAAPFTATVLENTRVSGKGSQNDVHHMMLSLEGGDLRYLDGQSLGVLPPGVDAKGKAHKLRLYSIASPSGGDANDGKTVSLCVKRVHFTNAEGELIHGVCSNHVCDANIGDTIQVTGPVGKSFLLPEESEANLIMVATGTGIAPFRAFLKNRYERRAAEHGQAHLFFGAQHYSDFLYQEWLESLAANEETFHLHTAFSREEQTESGERMYVQHRIFEHRHELFRLLQDEHTVFYMCGLRGMEEGIYHAFEVAAQECGLNWNGMYNDLKSHHRWHVEVY